MSLLIGKKSNETKAETSCTQFEKALGADSRAFFILKDNLILCSAFKKDLKILIPIQGRLGEADSPESTHNCCKTDLVTLNFSFTLRSSDVNAADI